MKCKTCKRHLEEKQFYPSQKTCKDCHMLRVQRWQKKNPEKVKNYSIKHLTKMKNLIEMGKKYEMALGLNQEINANGSNFDQVETKLIEGI